MHPPMRRNLCSSCCKNHRKPLH
uniref:Uncharacterized protein n=1 Tax=Anguilla anguilla TaxID=7936 RepID=A0A0E9SMS7_ANGAN